MLFRIFLLITAVAAIAESLPAPQQQQESTSEPAFKPSDPQPQESTDEQAVKHSDPQPQQESSNDTIAAPVWLTSLCIPTVVTCNAPNGCVLRDLNAAKQVFCSSIDDADISVDDGQSVVIETVSLSGDRSFFALPLQQGKLGGGFNVEIPYDAKSCTLKLVNAGSVSSANLECEFEKAATSTYVVDLSNRGEEVRKATKEEQLEQQEKKNSPNPANQGGDQQQKADKSQEKQGQEEKKNSPNPTGQGGDQQQKAVTGQEQQFGQEGTTTTASKQGGDQQQKQHQ